MKNIPLIAMCAVTLLLCLAINITFYSKIENRFDTVDSKLIEVDGRRNAQYGIIKGEIKHKLCEAYK